MGKEDYLNTWQNDLTHQQLAATKSKNHDANVKKPIETCK